MNSEEFKNLLIEKRFKNRVKNRRYHFYIGVLNGKVYETRDKKVDITEYRYNYRASL